MTVIEVSIPIEQYQNLKYRTNVHENPNDCLREIYRFCINNPDKRIVAYCYELIFNEIRNEKGWRTIKEMLDK